MGDGLAVAHGSASDYVRECARADYLMPAAQLRTSVMSGFSPSVF